MNNRTSTYYEWTAYFDGTHDSPDALHYYIDSDDDILVQGNELEFKLQLWRINRHWDNKHLSGYDIYCINDVGHSEIVNITSIEEFESVQMKTEAKINVTTIGVEKANTIAIYETNGTVFNGHYQEQERMNIIQLYVNDSGAGTPFVEGPNVIVIPTSLFTETIFNAYVQNETLHETPIYSADEEIFKFISVGRDGSTEQACDEIDFVFIRFDISSQEAMEILNLLLECLVNETTNETAIVYSYASTKINDTLAVMMNLPISVLGFIPWFCNFENSPIGSKPETKSDAFWKGIKKLVSLAVGLIITIGMAILELVELIGDFVMEILMEWLPILEFLLWLIIRVLILILIWIIFAIMLFLVIVIFVSVIALVVLLNCFMDLNIAISLNKIFVDGDIELTFKYNVDLEYHSFLKFFIPILSVYFEAFEKFAFEYSMDGFSEDFKFTKFPIDLFSDLNDNNPEESSNNNPKTSNVLSISENDICDLLIGIGTSMGIAGGVVAVISMYKTYIKDKTLVARFEILAAVAFLISMCIFIGTLFLDPSYWSFMGLGIGFLITGAAFMGTGGYIHTHRGNFMKWFDNKIGQTILFGAANLVDSIGAFVGLFLDIESFWAILEDLGKSIFRWSMVTISLFTGIASLILSTQFLIKFGGHYKKHPSISLYKYNADSKIDISLTFGLISLFLGFLFIFIASTILWED